MARLEKANCKKANAISLPALAEAVEIALS